MGNKSLSIKWKTFLVFFVFAIVLLGVLWLFQIIYLKDFYKLIKRSETEVVLDRVEHLVRTSDDCSSEIDKLAASNTMGIFVTDNEGHPLYIAEYIASSQISNMPHFMFELFYDIAVANGGEAPIYYKGGQMQKYGEKNSFFVLKNNEEEENLFISGMSPKNIEEYPEVKAQEEANNQSRGKIQYTLPDEDEDAFKQNIGNDLAESVIYVRIIEIDGQERVLMLNSVLTPVDATVGTLKVQLKLITIIIVAIAFLLGYLFSKNISHSIISINEGAKRLAKGDYSVKFTSDDYREVAELSDTLNHTAQELGKADGFQKELLANVSHDLRTPLTMIKGYSEVMRDIPGENTPENIQVIIEETERLSGLVNDMLDISKIKTGNITIYPEEYNITESICHVLERYNKLREVDGYIIDFVYDDEVEVYADEQKMYQVIYNLVNNAINYTGDDKKVTVVQKVSDDSVRIEVIDTGKGVSQEDIPYVWDRYYKAKTVHKRAIQGTGLGLAIVKNILELHGAKYGVSSVSGHGATFWFELRRERADDE
ncbi:MAG: HAMP domain-containing histidine kinase [Pseudobutyrivibrio sp.]|nr:HAMP domain-containing histidine kinase [Pseudobutyrivibrio sp.]